MTSPQPFTDQRTLPPTLPHGKAWPRISIVTPSYGQGNFIEETILSVLNQGYPDVEHIVIDGGSKDGTASVLDRYRDRLAYAVSEPDRGQSHAINKGMARATGEIVTWLNSDDRLAPGALAGMAMAFHTSGADMVAGMCELWRDGQLIDRHLTSCQDGPLPLDDLLDLDGCWNAGQFFFQPEVFFTKSLWDRAGGRVDEDSYYSMDYELWLRFAAAGARLKVIGRPVAQFRLHSAQKTADPKLFQAELPKTRARFLESRGIALPRRSVTSTPGRPARVIFLNDIGFQYGAGIAHQRLATAMEMAGHQITVVRGSNSPRSTPLNADEQARLLQQVAEGEPDVVIVGNLHSAGLSPAFLDSLARRWPTAFVVHDLWIVTGRCAYTKGCEKLLMGCDESCPTPTEYPPLEPPLIAAAWAAKHALLDAPYAPVLLANSEWTRNEVQRALGEKSPILQAITLGVGGEFVPADKLACRRLLNLPENTFLILLSASSLADPRKGRAQLLEALAGLDVSDAELILLGSGGDVSVNGFRVHRFLYQDDPGILATIYSAADVFVGPSLEECLGQVFLEAAACGVPSVGFRVGGVHEALLDGITGVLAATVTPKGLADALLRIHHDAALRNGLSIWARLAFENERTLERSYHHLHGVLRTYLPNGTKWFGRKISLRPPQTARVRSSKPLGDLRASETWEAVSGFGPWEGPYPELKLRRCRWQESRLGTFQVKVSATGRHTLLIGLRNLATDQHLRISCSGREVFSGPVQVSRNLEDTLLRVEVDLQSPRTLVTVEASSSLRSAEGRDLALLICDLQILDKSSGWAQFKEVLRRYRTRVVVLPGALWRSLKRRDR